MAIDSYALPAIAFPPVTLHGELQHVFCHSDRDEFLASAHAWLVLRSLSEDRTLEADEVWSQVQRAHDEALLSTADPQWAEQLFEKLQPCLLVHARFRQMWDSIVAVPSSGRTYH